MGRGDPVSFQIFVNLFEFFSGSKSLLIIFTLLFICSFFQIGSKIKESTNNKPKSQTIESSTNILISQKTLLLCWLLFPIILSLTISYLYKPFYYRKYFLMSSGAFYILAALGIDKLKFRILKILVIFLIVILSYVEINNSYKISQKPKWKEISEFVESNYQSNDLVIFYPDFMSNPFNFYSKNGYLQKKPVHKYKIDNTHLDQLRIWGKGNQLTIKEKNRIFEENHNRVWLIIRKSDEKSINIKKELSQYYKLILDNKFVDKGTAQLLLYSK
ncbi:MAG: hypothetical protein ACRENO_02790 [Thermodesulfobacteriota bacterium]